MPNYKKVSAGGSELVTNCEIGNDKKFDERGFVWVQITVKKYRVDNKNLFHLKYPTCKKLWPFFFFLYL